MDGWVNNRDAGDLRCHLAHYDVTEMWLASGVQLGGVLHGNVQVDYAV